MNHGYVGRAGAIRIMLQFDVMIFSIVFVRIEVGGYAYALMLVQSMDKVSSAYAFGSGSGDTYIGSFLFWSVAKRSIFGVSHSLNIALTT